MIILSRTHLVNAFITLLLLSLTWLGFLLLRRC
nr:MAG TPA_asm: hypothetical protein [Caudoviricetes sp.]